MLSLALPFTLVSILLLPLASAVPAGSPPSRTAGQSISLFRKPTSSRSTGEWAQWAKHQRDHLSAKYSDHDDSVASTAQTHNHRRKRSTGTNLLTNQNFDTSFFGTLAIGTPPVSFNVILDTGSADLWVASLGCNSCTDIKTFDPTASTSFTNASAPFNIQYGSGETSGSLGQDAVQMAGFSVPNQEFGLCDQLSDGLLAKPVSGILGLGFQTIAQSGATPFWQTLAKGDAWDAPVMAFHLTRFLDDSNANVQEPGGSFSMGYVNATLFTGDIEFTDIPSGQESYWVLPMTSITVSGSRFNLPDDSTSYAAIDTGTTLIGGPPDAVRAIFAQIPGSAPATGDFDGYYAFPCSNDLNVSLSFGGGQEWVISNQDMSLTQLDNGGPCIAALFPLETGSNAPSWIIGDTFLKNVYSVFRYTPPSVGFALLSDAALAMNGVNGPPPSATLGSAAATVSANSESNARKVTNGAGEGGVGRVLCASMAALVTGILVGCFFVCLD